MVSNDKKIGQNSKLFLKGSIILAIFSVVILVGSIVTQAQNIASSFTNNAFAEEPVNGTSLQIEDPADTPSDESDDTISDSDPDESQDKVVDTTDSEQSSSDSPVSEDNNNREYAITDLDTNENSYNIEETVNIEGSVNYVSPSDNVILTINDPNNVEIINKEVQIIEENDGSGTFGFEYDLGNDAIAGQYEVTAIYVDNEETTTFEVVIPSESSGSEETSTDTSENTPTSIEENNDPLPEEVEQDSSELASDNITSEPEQQQITTDQNESDYDITNNDEDILTFNPKIWTDRDDYAPGDIVIIYGSGFMPDSIINLSINHPDNGVVTWTSKSGENGELETTYRLDGFAEWYTVTATDEGSNRASFTFHDTPRVGSVSVGSQSPSSVTAGNSATFTVTVNRGSGGGSSGAFTALLSITSALPSGVTASFASSSLSFAPGDNTKSTTLTLSTSSSTPTGSHSFTVKAQKSDAAADSATGTGSLSVSAPADSTPPTTSASPTGGLYNSDQSVTLTSSEPATIYYTTDGTTPVISSPSGASPVSGISISASMTLKFFAKDAAGNSESVKTEVYTIDKTPPTITTPDDIIVEATSSSGAAVEFDSPTANDGSAVICDYDSSDIFPLGTTTVECQAIDTAGNTGSASFTVTVQDTTGPTITAPDDVTVEATGALTTIDDLGTATATDIVDGTLAVTNDAPDSFTLGITTVTYSATDNAGNTGSDTQSVTVQDTTGPELTVPDDIVEEATTSAGAPVLFSVTASDLVDGDVEPSCNYNSGDTFQLGITTVDCDATDNQGNIESASFTITVQDTTAPTLGLPDDIVEEATSSSGATVSFTATAEDAVDSELDISCNPESGSVFPLGESTVQCEVIDDSENSATSSFTVTVQDTTAPVITVPNDVVTEASSASGATVEYSVSASDIVDGETGLTCDHESGDTFPLGTTTVNCESTDGQSNIGSGSFTITVQDTTGPTITVPADMTVPPTGVSGATVTFSATATDAVDSSVSVLCTPSSGSTYAIGTTTVNCQALDDSGNSASKTFKVTVTGFSSNGFFKPVDMGSVINTAKGGSTIPLKFEVFAGSTEMTSTSVVKSYTQQKISCNSGPSDSLGTLSMTGNTNLRYDTTAGQFIANWKTPSQANTCWKVTITMQGDNTISALFRLN